jgi:hypothetical protein
MVTHRTVIDRGIFPMKNTLVLSARLMLGLTKGFVDGAMVSG